ncbi:MAG: general secretion pathway protein GspB [Nitrospiraceae bacterium]|nr:general secretion pathway protein GspB [Nitrospiraceae bacterium]
MSYILEALKKLEENRPESELPGLLHDPDHNAARPRMRRFLPHLLVAALLINAGIILWWLHPWDQTKPTVIVAGTPSPQTSFTPSVKGPLRAEDDIARRKKDDKQGIVSERKENTRNPMPAPSEAVIRPADMVREDRKVYSLADLPPSVRQDLPDIVISGHSYSSDPSARLVLINGKTMREGQVITGGLILQQITSDGVILSYKGYRVRRGVF